MDMLDVLTSRRSARAYTGDAVSRADLDKIVRAGLFAASGRGLQSPVLVCVTDRAVRDALSALNARVLEKDGFDPFFGAPAVIAVLADSGARTYVEDGALALGNMMNEAHALGLGSCWIHRAREVFASGEGKALKKKWGLSDSYEGVGFLIVGHAASVPPAAPRRDGRALFVEG